MKTIERRYEKKSTIGIKSKDGFLALMALAPVLVWLCVFLIQASSSFASPLKDAGVIGTPAREIALNQEPGTLEDILKALATYDEGQGIGPAARLREYVLANKDNPSAREACETGLAAFLETEASPPGKLAVCRMLRLIGSDKSVGALEKLLAVEETTDMARFALENIPGQAADQVLLDALAKTRGQMKIGIIASVGRRRSTLAVPALAKLLQGRDKDEARAAATALGEIGGKDAVSALSTALDLGEGDVKERAASSLLYCAEELLAGQDAAGAAVLYDKVFAEKLPVSLRQAALKGKITAAGKDAAKLILASLDRRDAGMHAVVIPMIPSSFDSSSLSPLLGLLPRLGEAGQVQLITVLAQYPGEAVLTTITRACRSPLPAVRIASARALEKAGDGTSVKLLAEWAASARGDEQKAVRETLWRLKGSDVDRAILSEFESSADLKVKSEIIQAIGERRITAGKGLLWAAAKSPSDPNRVEAVKNFKLLASLADLRDLIGLMLETKDETELEEMQNTVAAIARKNPRKGARADAVRTLLRTEQDVRKRCSLIRVLGKIGEDNALPDIRKAGLSPEAEIQDAVVRALCDWPTETARDDVLRIVRNSTDLTPKVLAFRAFVRMIGVERLRLAEGAVQDLKDALGLAGRPEEKLLVLGALPDFACADALKLAESLLSDAAVGAEAQAAVNSIKERLPKN